LLGEPAEFHGFVPEWGPLFWELGQHDADALLASGDAWQEMLAVLRVQSAEAAAFERIYIEALRRLEPLAGQDHVRWHELLKIILSWGLWRRPRQEREALLAAARAAQSDANRQKEVHVMGQTIADAIYEEGVSKGRAEGRSEGVLTALRQTLRRQLVERFGTMPEALAQRIETSTDVDLLQAALVRVLHIAAPEELQL
jgi:hypothetical protein